MTEKQLNKLKFKLVRCIELENDKIKVYVNSKYNIILYVSKSSNKQNDTNVSCTKFKFNNEIYYSIEILLNAINNEKYKTN